MHHLFAQEIGRQASHELRESGKKVKVSLGKTRAILFSFHTDALLRKSPLNISSGNQRMLLKKWKDPDSDERAHPFD